MDQFIVRKRSLVHLIAMHIDRQPDLRVFRKNFLGIFPNQPVKVSYSGKNGVEVSADVEAKYDSNWTQNLENISKELKKKLEKTNGIKVKQLTLSVRDVFYEKTNVE